ncbi:MAG TPA: hypothetical protein VMW58_13915 [Anaerolineae bacterium]|nr:hypothetical protein [Anaerolineae bacterium]
MERRGQQVRLWGILPRGKRGYRRCHGDYGGWEIAVREEGSTMSCRADYPNNASNRMVYGPFSLAGATVL